MIRFANRRSSVLCHVRTGDPTDLDRFFHYAGGGTNRQINFMVSCTERMHACISPSFDGLRGKFGGTGAVPCLVVTTKIGRSLSALAELAYVTRSTTAQSVPLQHSIGYQSWLAEGKADIPASISAAPATARQATRFRRIDPRPILMGQLDKPNEDRRSEHGHGECRQKN